MWLRKIALHLGGTGRNPGFGIVVGLGLMVEVAGGATLHVPGDYPAIQGAIDASAYEDTVLVTPGTYYERLHINHGMWLISEGGPNVTTIDAEQQGTVITIPGEAVGIRGFRIMHGNSSGFTAGGMHITGLGAVIQNNIIEHNFSLGFVGGVRCSQAATIEDNVFQFNNETGAKGNGALEAQGVIRRNVFRSNGGNGDFYIVLAKGTIENNVIVDNPALGGGVLGIYGGSIVRNNTLANNPCQWPTVQIEGSNIQFTNNLVIHLGGDGLWCGFTGGSQVISCNNVWGVQGDHYTDDCAIEAGIHNNFSADPRFCDPAHGDYRLQPDSPGAPGNSPAGCGLIGALPVCSATSVAEDAAPSAALRFEVQPNPARRAVEFILGPGTESAAIDIYDILGRQVATLHPIGPRIGWAPAEGARGVYFARLTSHGEIGVVKFIVLE